MNYNIIATGSDGNATIIDDKILIDCGVSYKKVAPFVKKLQLVLLTHKHNDHINKATISRLASERPKLRFGCCEWLVQELLDCGVSKKRIDVYKIGNTYDYSIFKVVPIKLYHDVPQCGYRLFIGDYKCIYCTDTRTLEGIKAENYDYYFIEANYENEQELHERAYNDYYEKRVKSTHLSKEQATEWLLENMGANSVYEFMHGHKERLEKYVDKV